MRIHKFPPNTNKESLNTATFITKVEAIIMFREATKCNYVDSLRYFDANFVDAKGITTRELAQWIRAYYEHIHSEQRP